MHAAQSIIQAIAASYVIPYFERISAISTNIVATKDAVVSGAGEEPLPGAQLHFVAHVAPVRAGQGEAGDAAAAGDAAGPVGSSGWGPHGLDFCGRARLGGPWIGAAGDGVLEGGCWLGSWAELDGGTVEVPNFRFDHAPLISRPARTIFIAMDRLAPVAAGNDGYTAPRNSTRRERNMRSPK